MTLLLAANNSVVLHTIATLSKNKKLLLNNSALRHYLSTKHLDFSCEINITLGVLIKKYSIIICSK